MIGTDGSVKEIQLEPGLKPMQQIVGGYIEMVSLPIGWDRRGLAVLWVNEEGLLKGLPENELASSLAQQRLVGPALLTGLGNEDLTDLPAHWSVELVKEWEL